MFVGQRLLRVDVLAEFHRRHRRGVVRVVGRGDRDDVDLVAHRGEHLAVVLEFLRARVAFLAAARLLAPLALEAVAVDIAECDHLRLRVRGDLRGVGRALAAGADVRAGQSPVWRVGAQPGG